MYVSIRNCSRVVGSVDNLIHDGRRLTSAVGELTGFVAYALFDAGEGVLVSVSVFDDEVGLAAADRLVQAWIPTQDVPMPAALSEFTSGEVILQKGL